MKFLREGHREVGFYDKDGKLGLVADEQIVKAIGFGAEAIYRDLSKDADMKRICNGIIEIHKRA